MMILPLQNCFRGQRLQSLGLFLIILRLLASKYFFLNLMALGVTCMTNTSIQQVSSNIIKKYPAQ